VLGRNGLGEEKGRELMKLRQTAAEDVIEELIVRVIAEVGAIVEVDVLEVMVEEIVYYLLPTKV
jgi:hypothetical protein